ncbi:MAG: radical SAM protein [Candidatus Sulfotelmatobacter sp.]
MRILLISAANDAGSIVPLPLGLACVAAATERAGHCVRLLALGPDADCENDVRKSIKQFAPDVIGVSVRNIDDQNMQSPRFLLGSLKQVVAVCRTACSSPVVLGGAGYSIFPESALACLGGDMGIRGEGETAFPALLSWLEQGAQSPPPPAMHFPNGSHSPTAFAPVLDDFLLPEPRFWLDFPGSTEMRIPVQTRRGCPLDCIYCSTSLIEGRPIRRRSPQLVVEWLTALRHGGFRHFHFVDNTFNLPPSYAKDLCRKLIGAELGLDWWGIIYPKWVDAELAELMAKAGCTQVSLGFESGSETMLPQLNKRFTCREVREISDTLAAAGVERYGFLLLGGPGETRETVEESLEFADSLHLDALKITVGLRIYPETPLASTALEEGLITPEDNLLFPHFYIGPLVRDWLPDRIARRESDPG